jgi:hypothetical protein
MTTSIRSRAFLTYAAAILVADSLCMVGCTSTDKCGSSPVIKAVWQDHTKLLYRCGGLFDVMPTTNPSTNGDADTAAIQLSVGQELTLARGGGWANHQLSNPVTSSSSVVRLAAGPSHDTFATYIALAPGLAYVGAESDVCGTGTRNTCDFALVRVTP